MIRKEPKLLGAIIDDMFARTGIMPQYKRQSLAAAWTQVVGPNIAAYTQRAVVADSTLHVYITSPALKEELGYAREALVPRLNSAVGDEIITNIVIH